MSSNSPAGRRELHTSAILLAVAAGLLVTLWATEVAGDPTGGVVFYMLAFASSLVVGIGLVVAASRRRDLFGTYGLVGSVVVLVGAVLPGIGLVVAAVGLVMIGLSVRARARGLVIGAAIAAAGLLGLVARLQRSDDATLIFVPVVAVGTAVLAAMLLRLDRDRNGSEAALPLPKV